MESEWLVTWALRTLVFAVVACPMRGGAATSGEMTMTIGGVVYTDAHDPLRSGLEGVAVEVRGEKGVFKTVTSGVIGLWKVDVPYGTYTVTPMKSAYVLEHMVGGWSDGQGSITIEVRPENIAANQSIQFLAIETPEVETPPPPASRETGPSGGGCAVAPGGHAKPGEFFAPYFAGMAILLVRSRTRRCGEAFRNCIVRPGASGRRRRY